MWFESSPDIFRLFLSVAQGALSTATGLVPSAGLSSQLSRKVIAYLSIAGEFAGFTRALDLLDAGTSHDIKMKDVIKNLVFGGMEFSSLPLKDDIPVLKALYKVVDTGYGKGSISKDFVMKTSSILADVIGDFQSPGLLKVGLKAYAAAVDSYELGTEVASRT